ncbi:MAG: ATP-binding cassette domain-containing protein [Chitinophagaceae bacterium]|nr:ATP-binding cassette domain-containing protein [Chitinophagaceae bacterium]
MRIRLSQVGKRFNRDWIFRKASLDFTFPNTYAITGPNGSGKSTLLQIIGCILQPSEGTISFTKNQKEIAAEKLVEYISFCAPYLDVIEEMTLFEFLRFHSHFKPIINSFDLGKIIEIVDLKNAAQKQIRYYSSGMKQRVKLAQAIFSNTPVLLLDEPCTNLDTAGIELYYSLINNYCQNRLIIVSSNDEIEYKFCRERVPILDYK